MLILFYQNPVLLSLEPESYLLCKGSFLNINANAFLMLRWEEVTKGYLFENISYARTIKWMFAFVKYL